MSHDKMHQEDTPGATAGAGARPLFAAVLRPHRSLSRTGFAALMLVFGGLAGSSSLAFLSLGAWPVIGFLALDVAIVAGAFLLNYRSGRQYEEVVVTQDSLTIRRVSAWGRVTEERLHPFWTRLKTAYDAEEGVVLAVKLESKGRQVPVGAFMNPRDKESFANALGAVLAEVKRGPVLP